MAGPRLNAMIIVALLVRLSVCANQSKVFELIGMFTITDYSDPNLRDAYGIYPREAAKLAVEHVRAEGILTEHNYDLEMFVIDTPCDQTGAVVANLEYARVRGADAKNIPYSLIGPLCSISADLIASMASRYTRIVQVSYGVLSPLFSNTHRYSYFYRTIPAFSEYVKPITAILQHFDWQVIGIVHSETPIYTLLTEYMSEFLIAQNLGFRIGTTLSTTSHFSLEGSGFRNTVRIFIGLVDKEMAADTLCAAYLSRLTGSDFVWILFGDFLNDWWLQLTHMNCTEVEMLQAVESMLMLSNTAQVSHRQFMSIRGQNNSEFWTEYKRYLKRETGIDFVESHNIRVLQAYDAVWSIAMALNTTLATGNFSLPLPDTSSKPFESTSEVQRLHIALNQNMKQLSFEGTSGKLEFTNSINGPAFPLTTIFQMQNGSMIPVGIHMDNNLNFLLSGNNLMWQGVVPPRDRPVVTIQVVELWIMIIMLTLTFIGIVYATVILMLNCVHRKHKVIKASSPYINILIITGCILGLLIIPVISIENFDVYHTIPDEVYLMFCNFRPWMANFSITLAFGALFAKTWRVYMVFRNPWAKRRPYKDHVLLSMIGVLLTIDAVLNSIATWRAPFKLITYRVPSTEGGQFTLNVYRICLANSNFLDLYSEIYVWLAVFSVYKLLLFLFGVFLVIQTSKIKAKFFQDSKYIGLCIYATFAGCSIGLPISTGLMIALEEDIGYICVTLVILFCTYFILSAVFIPRFLLLRKYKKRVPTAVLIGLNPSFRVKRPFSRSATMIDKLRALKDSKIECTAAEGNIIKKTSQLSSTTLKSTIPSIAPSMAGGPDGPDDSDLLSNVKTVWVPTYDDDEPSSPTGLTTEDFNSTLQSCYISCQDTPVNENTHIHFNGDNFISSVTVSVQAPTRN